MPVFIPKIVIDTNIYISAIFWGGKPRMVVDFGRSGQVLIFASSEIEKKLKKILRVTSHKAVGGKNI